MTDDTGGGNPRDISAEKGAAYLDVVIRKIADLLVDLAAADLDDLYARLTADHGLQPVLSAWVHLYKEIAAVMGISPKTVETQMGRAMSFLREHLLRVSTQNDVVGEWSQAAAILEKGER